MGGEIQPSLRDLAQPEPVPGVRTPGYSQMLLRSRNTDSTGFLVQNTVAITNCDRLQSLRPTQMIATMHTTNNLRTRIAWYIVAGIVVLWQLVVLVLAGGGIFVDIYELFGIPWNLTGFVNVVGTTLGFLILELPVLILTALLFLGRRKR